MTDEIEKIVPKKNCIRFWKSMLFHNRAFLATSTVVIIEATIKHLAEDELALYPKVDESGLLTEKIKEILEAWEEQDKGCILPFSYEGIAQEIAQRDLTKRLGEGLKVLTSNGEWVEASEEFKDTVRSIDKGLEKLDRPDREKIAKYLLSVHPEKGGFPWESMSLFIQGVFLDQADQILTIVKAELRSQLKELKLPSEPDIDSHIWRDYTPDMAYEKAQQDTLKAIEEWIGGL